MEYYLPHFRDVTINNKLKTLLKKPSLREDINKQVLEILTQIPEINKNLESERNQIITLIRNITTKIKILDLLESDSNLLTYFFDVNPKSKNISNHCINKKDDDQKFIEVIGLRIYDIRNKLIHHKSNYDNSRWKLDKNNIELLENDIIVLNYIVQDLIINQSKPLTI